MSSDGNVTQKLKLGRYQSLVEARLDKWQNEQVGARIWQKDFTVWSPAQVPEITDRLGWLRLPETMMKETASLAKFAQEIKADGFKHVVLLGMGGSSLAPEVYQRTFANQPGFPRLIVLDSTHPDHIRAVESQVDLATTLFLVASKSGTTQEPLSMFRYFFARLSRITSTPGRHFAATTDPGTPLEQLASERRFRRVFKAAPDVGGRYSALTAFGLAPAALIGTDVKVMLERACGVSEVCGAPVAAAANPGLVLGAALGELALAGRDKATFFTCQSLAAFPDWLEQLIAESTGKDGRGVIPIAGEMLGEPEAYGRDRFFIYITTEHEVDASVESQIEDLARRGHPTATIVVKDRIDLAGEMFRWEMAVAAAGSALGIHPFNQPDVQLAKDLARRAMAKAGDTDGSDKAEPVTPESREDLTRVVDKLMSSARPGDYFTVQAYLAPSEETVGRLQEIRRHVRDTCRLATTVGIGPRFLHSTGQLHKGGPNTGIYLQIVDIPREDVAIPEAGYTFGRLIRAQAQGDYEALLGRGRRVLRINLGKDPGEGLKRLADAVKAQR
jgi:transaldolase/glucose-6-phosphate isomerase